MNRVEGMPAVPVPWGWTVTALAVYTTLAVAGLVHHEMWRDELEIWLIARDSSGLGELFRNMSTEGHPALWYLLTFAVARFTPDPRAMQALNLVVGIVTAGFLLRRAPFGILERTLLVFGYYVLYEFTVISRSYGLGLLLLLIACDRIGRRGRIDLPAALVLALLANTHLFGAIAAGCLLLWRAVESVPGPGAALPFPERRERLAALAVLSAIGLGFAHTLAQSLAIGADHAGAHHPGWDATWVAEAFSTVFRGAVPLADPAAYHSWNSNLLERLPAELAPWVGGLLGLALIAGATIALRRRPPLLGSFLLGTATMLALTLFVWFGSTRHHGQIFLWFVACLWILRSSADSDAPRSQPSLRAGVVLLLLLQVAGGAYALARDLRLPFSQAGAVGAYLMAEAAPSAFIVGSVDYSVQPIAAFLDRPIYYPESGTFATFLDWSDARRLVSPERVLAEARALSLRRSGEGWLVLSYALVGLRPGRLLPLGDGVGLRYETAFTGALVPDENFHLYRLLRTPPTGPGDVDSPPSAAP